MSRDLGAIVQPAINLAELAARVREQLAVLQRAEEREEATDNAVEAAAQCVVTAKEAVEEAKVKVEVAEEDAKTAEEEAKLRRLELGRALVEARKAWPAKGPGRVGGKSWSEWLEEQGTEQKRAWDCMKYAEHVAVQEVSGGGRALLKLCRPGPGRHRQAASPGTRGLHRDPRKALRQLQEDRRDGDY